MKVEPKGKNWIIRRDDGSIVNDAEWKEKKHADKHLEAIEAFNESWSKRNGKKTKVKHS